MHHTNHLIIAAGIPHSGMHAIMEWLLPQEDITFLVNDLQHPPALERRRHPDLSAVPESDLLIVSLERCKPDTLIDSADEIEFTSYRSRTFMLMIRDPLNFLSSTIQHWRGINRTDEQIRSVLRNVVPCWKEFAKEYVGDTDFISNKIFVNFNVWFSDYSYRRMISKTLNTRFTDQSRDQVATTGGWISSAFDARKYAGRATDMDVLGRWRGYILDKLFLEFCDDEIIELGHRIYGPWMPSVRAKNNATAS